MFVSIGNAIMAVLKWGLRAMPLIIKLLAWIHEGVRVVKLIKRDWDDGGPEALPTAA